MNRSYDIFVDNGLYILAYYLEKNINDISYEDIENSIEFMSQKVEEYLECEKYSNMKTMVLFNSAVSNPSLKNVKLEKPLKDFLNQKGDEYCMLCGENHANSRMNLKGRSYLPNKPSSTYFNFSNNFHNINICPYCLLLTAYSVMNCRVSNYVYLYNSSDNEFMEEFTIKMQEENKQDILLKSPKAKSNKNTLETLLEMIDYNISFDSEIEIYKFNNGKTEEIANTDKIYSENIKLIRKMRNKSLLDEFRSLNKGWLLIRDNLKGKYINEMYDFDKNKLKCSEELFNFLKEEVNMLDKNTIELIDRITTDLLNSKIDIIKIRNKIKNIKTFRSFDDVIIEIQELYYESESKNLFDKYEYNELVNIRKFNYIKNMMLIDLAK